MPRTDRSPLTAAVADALDAYDVIVLLPRYWFYPDRESATAHVVLGEIDIFPHTDCRTALPGPKGEEKSVPLSPEQSAAVLRERCLGFLFGSPHTPIQLDGVIWQSNRELPVDADYLEGVDGDMNRAGLRPLGWTLSERWPSPHRQLPEPDQLKDLSFVQRYQPIAKRLRTALDARPARRNWLDRAGLHRDPWTSPSRLSLTAGLSVPTRTLSPKHPRQEGYRGPQRHQSA
ncbi:MULTISPECIES: hypothetical protein [unclassified Streptomyces]|uniref:hypothetical protein n=1 Tax=unclassified Streptomyces TaxID=2593676 RepID=UPI0033D84E9B